MGIFYAHAATESTIESELNTIMQVVTESGAYEDKDEGIPYYKRFRSLFVDSFFTMLMKVIDFIRNAIRKGIDYIVRKFKIGKRGQELAAKHEAKKAAKERVGQKLKDFENSPDFTLEPVRISLVDTQAVADTIVTYLQKAIDHIVTTASALSNIGSDAQNLTSELNSLHDYVNVLTYSVGSNFERLADLQYTTRSFVPVPFPKQAENLFASKMIARSEEDSLETVAIERLMKQFARLREKLQHAQKTLNTSRDRFKHHPDLLENASITQEDLEHAHTVFAKVSTTFNTKSYGNVADFLVTTSDKNRDIIKNKFDLIIRQCAYFRHKELLS